MSTKQIFENLLSATPLLNHLYNNAKVHAMLVSDADGYILHCNETFLYTYGYSLNDLVGKHGRILFTEEDQKNMLPERETETTKSLGFFRDRNYVMHKNGDCIFSDGETILIKDEDGHIFLFKILQSIHEQKVLEGSLRQSGQRMRNLIEEAPVATAVYIGEDMHIEYANQAMLKIMGKGTSVLGKPFSEALPELANQHFPALLKRVYTTGETYVGQEDKADVLVDGKMHSTYYNFSYKPLRDENGEIYGVLNMAVDVGEQVRARERLQESKEYLQRLIRQAPVSICIIRRANTEVEIINDAFLELIGKRREAAEGKNYWEALPEVATFYAPIFEKVFQTGVAYQGTEHEVTLTRSGKPETIYASFVLEPIAGSDGTVEQVMILAVDVTAQVMARHKIEEVVALRTKELAEANQSLKQSNAELAQFAYVASHDLQEPLRKIQVFGGYLQAEANENLSKKEQQFITKILEAARRMSDLIKGILDYSRTGVAKSEQFPPVDLNKVLEQVRNDLEIELKEKEAVIEADRLPVLPALEVQMHQLFFNLLSNSLKFSSDKRKPVIRIKAEEASAEEARSQGLSSDTPFCKLVFSDNGIGFSPSYKERIFAMFQRLHAKAEYEGTGIGLAICKKVVENHDGSITAEGEPGKGATFTMFLPCVHKG